MPISQLLPDGKVRIYNKKTGQTADVKPDELGSYSPELVGQYQNAVAQRDAVKTGQLTVEQLPQDNRTVVASGLSASGYTPEDKKKKEAKADTLQKAEALMGVIQQGKQGKLKGKEYEDALASLASQYTASKAFGEGGKNLTNTELAILSGQTPVIEKRTGNVIDKAIAWAQGREVPQRGVVVDDPKTLERKMLLAIAALKGEQVNPEQLNAVSGSQQNTPNEFLQNAGEDAKNILNSILGIPGQAVDTIKTSFTDEDPQKRLEAAGNLQLNNILGNAAKGYASNLNEDLGRPLEGGDILDRAGKNAYERPVGTALDVLPFLGGAASKLSGGAKPAPRANVPMEVAGQSNKAQNTVQAIVDAVNGAGSKEYIARTSGKSYPQNKVLMDEGVLMHPTETGRIQATQAGLSKYGEKIGEAYKNSDRHFKGTDIDTLLTDKLKGQGYDGKAIDYIKNYVNQQGGFDMSSGDAIITMEKAWTAAKKLESNPPKMLKNPESSLAYQKLSKDAARIIRQSLGEKVPETKDFNARYSALRDYMDNILPEKTEGIKTNPIASSVQSAKNVSNVANNALYKALGINPTKLLRDNRTGTKNLRFRGT